MPPTTTSTEVFTLTEYGSSPPVALAAPDVALAAKTFGLGVALQPDGRVVLEANSKVGVLSLGDRTIVVSPKVAVPELMFLLAYTFDPDHWQRFDGLYATTPSPLEALVPALVRAVDRATARGLLHDYVVVEEALPYLRGRLRVGAQIQKRFGRSDTLEVVFDEHTSDTTLNRLLLAALERCRHLALPSADLRRSVARQRARLEDSVSLVAFDPDTFTVPTWTRLNAHYRPAVELALLLLRRTSLQATSGGQLASSFVVDMNVLFEDFLRTALRVELGVAERAFPRGRDVRRSLDSGGRIGLEPDLSWWTGNVCRFAGDAKYKRLGSATHKHGDPYQALAYAIGFELPEALLVYAQGEAEEQTLQIPHAEKTITVTHLRLHGGPDAILADVARIARIVRRMAGT